MLPVAFRRVQGGLHSAPFQGFDQCLAVVFIQTGPGQCWCTGLHPARNAGPGLLLASQGARQHHVKVQAMGSKMLTQPVALAFTQRAEPVVVLTAKRGLPVPDQI